MARLGVIPAKVAAIALTGILLAAGMNALVAKPVLADATHQAVIGMPFTGHWAYNIPTTASCGPSDAQTSHPSCHLTDPATGYLWGDWATDVFASVGTPVKLEVIYPSTGVTFTWGSSSTSCGTSTLINVLVNGVLVGSIYYDHLQGAVTSGAITNGMTVGTVQIFVNGTTVGTDPKSACNRGPHVHLELKNAPNTNHACYVNYSNANYTAGMVENEGAALGVLGSSNTGRQQACSSIPSGGDSASAPLRIGILFTSGAYSAKEGSLGAGWVTEANDSATQVLQNGTLSGMVWHGGLYVKQGALTNSWVTQTTTNTVNASISDAVGSTPIRIGVLQRDGSFWVKEGLTSTSWVDEYSANVVAGSVSGSRIAVLLSSGAFLVKDGGLEAGWVTEYSANVTQGVINGSLIAVIVGGVLFVKQGGLGAGWVTEQGDVADVQLSDATSSTPLRIGEIDTASNYWVKEGLYGGWVLENGSVSQASISGDLIGVVIGGNVLVKQGGLGAGWVLENGSAVQVALWSPN